MTRKVEKLQSLEKLRVLSDSRRLKILRVLMGGPATLTQLAARLGKSPAWIRHHLKVLELAGLVLPDQIRTTGRVTEKFYRAAADGLLLETLILPKTRKPVVVFAGSHDLAVQALGRHVSQHRTILALHIGSLNGLMRLRQGLCQVAGAHLLDDDGRYNVDFVHHIFPEGGVELYTLAQRTQGLMLVHGNPKRVRGVADLARPGIRLVRRNAGSGTRLRLERQMHDEGIDAGALQILAHEATTHTEAANLIRLRRADAAIGLEAAAAEAGLDFLPLFEERYDLVVSGHAHKEADPLLDYIQSSVFRAEIAALAGYSASHTGEQVPL